MASPDTFDVRRYRELYEELPAVVCVLTATGDVAFASERYRTIFDAQLPGERTDPTVHPADAASPGGSRLASVLGDRARLQCRLRVRGGVYRWFQIDAGVASRAAGAERTVILTDIDDEKRSVHYLGVLAEAGSRFATTADVDRALLAVARLVVPFACDWFVVYRPDPENRFAATLAHHADPARAAAGALRLADTHAGDDRLVARVARTRAPLVLARVADPRERGALDAASTVLVPILGRETLWGVLQFIVEAPGTRRLDDGDLRFARELASRTASAFDGIALVASEQRAARELRFLAEIGEKLGDSLDLERRLQLVVQAVVPRFADWATVNLVDDDDGSIVTAAIAHKDPALAETAARLCGPYYGDLGHLTGTPTVLRSGRSELLADVDEAYLRRHIRPEVVADVLALGSDAAFVVPLVAQGHIYGTLSTMRTQRERPFSDAEMWLIEEVARRAAVAIANARLFARQATVADALQRASLPSSLPQTLGLDFSAFYAPGRSEAMIGGDWYDAFRLADGRIVFSIGDVSGNGLQAAVVMGCVRQLIRGAAQVETGVAAILDATDRALRVEHPDTYVTAFVGILDPVAMRVTHASAGHPPPLLRTPDGRIDALTGPGLPLGLRDGDGAPARVRDVEDGTLFVLYTDGLTESTHDVLAGEARLRDALANDTIVAAPDVARALYDRVVGDAPMDDVAILTVAVRAGRRWRFDARRADLAHAALAELVEHLDAVCEPSGDAGVGLIFLELVGNVVRHAPGPVDVAIDWDGDVPVLDVSDEGPGFRAGARRKPRDPLAESGRGLFLVGAYAERFEIVRRESRGSRARATLRMVRRAAPPAGP